MSSDSLLKFGNPLLREGCGDISDVQSEESETLKNSLRTNLTHLQKIHKKGGGIAAPQLGWSRNLVFVKAQNREFFLFNPVITHKSSKLFDVWDFCFSGNASFLANIQRHYNIEVEYLNESGEKKTENFEGYWAELLQHEIDHLNGVLFIDHIKNPQCIMMVEEWDKQFNYNKI